MYHLGLDVGSLSCDGVLIDDQERIVAWSVVPTGARNRQAIARARDEVARAAGLPPDALTSLVATGYGRNRVEGRSGSVTEITCHARGIRALLPGVVLLPHLGSATLETRSAMADLAVENVRKVLRGDRPLTPVRDISISKQG